MNAVTVVDENDESFKSTMKRIGSRRKIFTYSNIRQQLNEQLRSLDIRIETQVAIIQELQDFFRRRAELELDYSKSLDKFARSLLLRHKEPKQKRDDWSTYTTFACWQHLVTQTQASSKYHATLSEIYSINIVASLQKTIDHLQRIYKKCRAIGYEIHEDIFRILQELHATMKTYQKYENECKAAETKLNTAETQKVKLQQTIKKNKLECSKKYRLTEKEMLKRKSKHNDAKLKALKAKNEYLLCLDASNTTVHKYFVEDLSDLIDCMDLGLGSMISTAILMHISADQGRSKAIQQQADSLTDAVHSIDIRADKQTFLENYHTAFMIPQRLELKAQHSVEDIDPNIQTKFYFDMEQKLQALEKKVYTLHIECNEIWKSLEMAEIKLLEHINIKTNETSELFESNDQAIPLKPLDSIMTPKYKADQEEIENYYISKIQEYMKGTSRIARLDAKAKYLRNLVESKSPGQNISLERILTPTRKRIGYKNKSVQPKLFGGSLEEYLECTGEDIPLILQSCVRIINLFGLQHQGIFRVSGSQLDITNFREVFERGEDPLIDITDVSDINSVAGVLKLYLRELREPLFPIIYFDYFISIAELHTKEEIMTEIRKFLQCLPCPILIVIRYLFAFLNHLSEYSDENMMDAHNLAVCFGPTLFPVPEGKNQIQCQHQVNELIKNIIVYQDELFPKDLGGLKYEKYISHDIYLGNAPAEILIDEPCSETNISDD